MASTSSFYEVLGVPTSASCHEIKAAYRRLARNCHPDVVAINQKEWSANEFKRIHVAYATLSDPEKRAHYDVNISRQRWQFDSISATPMRMTATAGTELGYSYTSTCRNWETDQCW